MIEKTARLLPVLLLPLVWASAANADNADALKVGKAAKIEKIVTGKQNGPERKLHTGDAVYLNELIAAHKESTGQFTLLDDTKLVVGPGSQLTLDKFIYDPKKKTGDIVINATKGAFRFVTGSANKAAYKIKTPKATIGVRGTIFDWYVLDDGEAAVALVSGELDVCGARGNCQPLRRPGRFIHIRRNGLLSGPLRWDGKFLNHIAFVTAFPFLNSRNSLLPGFRGPRLRLDRILAPGLRLPGIRGPRIRPPRIRPPRIRRPRLRLPRLLP